MDLDGDVDFGCLDWGQVFGLTSGVCDMGRMSGLTSGVCDMGRVSVTWVGCL